ncbi:MAG: DUF1801 domain-containing protein [Flavobacteriaceae bacterium]|nr:DUF1801 domain-containing protein [Flavobacteriaceae bacterium]
MNNQVNEYIENAPQEQQEIMKIVREIIHNSVPKVVEEFKWSRPIFISTKDFANFMLNKNDVTIGFTKDYEKLNDHNKILEVTGKTTRHIKLKKASGIDGDLLKDWFKVIKTN